jgi:predicted unusual protein kinase regulating ubiquinone biosynthesis (AarF/ABC1/UbiB family)
VQVLRFLGALLRRDPEEMADVLLALGFATRDGARESLVSLAQLGLAVAAELADHGALTPERLEAVGEELLAEVRSKPLVRVPAHVVLLGRTLGLLSGLAHQLDAGVDPLPIVLPYVVGVARPS